MDIQVTMMGLALLENGKNPTRFLVSSRIVFGGVHRTWMSQEASKWFANGLQPTYK